MIPNPKAFDNWESWGNSVTTILTPFMQSVENTFFDKGESQRSQR